VWWFLFEVEWILIGVHLRGLGLTSRGLEVEWFLIGVLLRGLGVVSRELEVERFLIGVLLGGFGVGFHRFGEYCTTRLNSDFGCVLLVLNFNHVAMRVACGMRIIVWQLSSFHVSPQS